MSLAQLVVMVGWGRSPVHAHEEQRKRSCGWGRGGGRFGTSLLMQPHLLEIPPSHMSSEKTLACPPTLPAPTKPFVTLLFARQQCSPFCLQVLPLQTLITASTTLFHTYLFAHHHNNAHQCLLPTRHCSGLFTCIVSFNLHDSPFQ